MMRKLIYILAALLCTSACITNDLPYPVVVPNLISIDAEGAESVDINYEDRVATLHFPEQTDLRSVLIRSYELDQEIAVPSIELVGEHDLTSPLKFTLRTYDDYAWKIVAVRNVERYFTVEGQIGSSVIDAMNLRAVAMVGMSTDISDIEVTSLKLGPEGLSDYSMDISQMKDFTHGISVDVEIFGVIETWRLYVEQTDLSVDIKEVNPWAHMAYVTSTGIAGRQNGFRYREKGYDMWTDVAEADVVSDGGTFTACIRGLEPLTVYEVVAYCGDDVTSPVEFTTENAAAIPNGSFEYASKVSGKDYYKFYDPDCGVEEGMFMFWGSGNGEGSEGVSGSANMGIVITYVDTEDKVHGKQSVRAQTSQMAGILAAGNLFTGQFAGLVGTSGGKVNFGRPWTTRPTAMKLYCKYSTGKMDIVNGMPPGVTLTKDDYDCAEIKFALGCWDYKKYGGTADSPVHINTTDPGTFVDFNNDPSTVAYGNLLIQNDGYVLNGAEKTEAQTSGWIEYIIPLDYHSMTTLPTHLIISCAASRYGDYFSGCSTSKLWIDAVELIY